jgi:hypothetical protein
MSKRGAVIASIGVIAVVVVWPARAMAHGIGGRSDLPVPLSYFLAGSATVLIVTFASLAVLWPRPRLQQEPVLRPIRIPGWRWIVFFLRVMGLGGLLLVASAGLFGTDNAIRNPAPVLVWVVFWLGIPFAGAAVGDLYRLMSPWDSLARFARLGEIEKEDHARSWGVWPATLVFIAFIWLELIYPNSAEPRTVAIASLVYTALLLGCCEWMGRRTAVASFDPFATYNRLITAIAPFDLHPGVGPRWRGWFRALPNLPVPPGLTVFVVAMIGTVSFDGLSATFWYDETFGGFGNSIGGGTALLLVSVGLVGGAYWSACWSASRLTGRRSEPGAVGRRFAHTLVPIALAYAFAHYFTLLIFEGQLIFSTMSDPFNLGWDLFGTAGRPVDYTLVSPMTVWWVQVIAIVSGHVAGVVLAHDRALQDFTAAGAVRSQYAMLALMVFLTGLGLTILAAS